MDIPRFREIIGKMMIIAPDSGVETRPVKVFYDSANPDWVWIQFIGDSELRGYIVGVEKKWFEAAMMSGKPVNELKIV